MHTFRDYEKVVLLIMAVANLHISNIYIYMLQLSYGVYCNHSP